MFLNCCIPNLSCDVAGVIADDYPPRAHNKNQRLNPGLWRGGRKVGKGVPPSPPRGVRSPFLRFFEGGRKYILFIVSALRNYQIRRSRYRVSLHASISPTESTLHGVPRSRIIGHCSRIQTLSSASEGKPESMVPESKAFKSTWTTRERRPCTNLDRTP
jgi:hypothetical protein